MLKKNFLFMFLVFLCFTGCIHPGKERLKIPEVSVPQKYNFQSKGNFKGKKWWMDFNSSQLNSLVEKALKNNNSIKSSFESLKKAEAALKKAGAPVYPELDLKGNASINQNHNNSASIETKSSSFGLAASYELDLWGRIDSEKKAALFSKNAAQKDLEAAAITISAEVVTAWKNLIFADKKLRILKEVKQKNIHQLKILRTKFQKGSVKASDVYEQKKVTLFTSTKIRALESNMEVYKNRLSFLVGERVDDDFIGDIPMFPDFPETGIPMDILSNRPDVNASLMRLKASQEKLLASYENLFPKITLSGSLNLTSDDFSLSFDKWISSLASGITMPLFKGGYLRNEVKRSLAQRNEYLFNYANTILKAVNEVEDSISREKMQRDIVKTLDKRLLASQSSTFYSRLEYISGSSTYISYLDKLNAFNALKINLITEKSNLIEYRISMYRALGSSWTEEFVENRERTGNE